MHVKVQYLIHKYPNPSFQNPGSSPPTPPPPPPPTHTQVRLGGGGDRNPRPKFIQADQYIYGLSLENRIY